METSGQPKYDSTSMGGGKMKQLKITKRQAALMLLELCHGFLILFAIYACAVVISDRKSTRLNSSHASKSRMPSSA